MLVHGRSRPIELTLMLAGLAYGIYGLTGPPDPDSAAANLFAGYAWLYYSTLAVGALITLVGAFWATIYGIYIERAGLLIFGGLLVSYGAGSLIIDQSEGVSLLIFGVGVILQAAQITAQIHTWKQQKLAEIRVAGGQL